MGFMGFYLTSLIIICWYINSNVSLKLGSLNLSFPFGCELYYRCDYKFHPLSRCLRCNVLFVVFGQGLYQFLMYQLYGDVAMVVVQAIRIPRNFGTKIKL